jgi:elongation factor P--beta-lysine ligase
MMINARCASAWSMKKHNAFMSTYPEFNMKSLIIVLKKEGTLLGPLKNIP